MLLLLAGGQDSAVVSNRNMPDVFGSFSCCNPFSGPLGLLFPVQVRTIFLRTPYYGLSAFAGLPIPERTPYSGRSPFCRSPYSCQSSTSNKWKVYRNKESHQKPGIRSLTIYGPDSFFLSKYGGMHERTFA